jgi:hypothetical protein
MPSLRTILPGMASILLALLLGVWLFVTHVKAPCAGETSRMEAL